MIMSNLNPEKYNRSVSLHCPTCAGTDFEGADDEGRETVKCANCGREITRDDLVEENSELISEYVREIGDEVTKDIADEFTKTLKQAFKDSKFIKVK